MSFKILDTKTILKNKYIEVYADRVLTAKKQLIRNYYRIVKKHYVVVVADDGRDIIFVREYRHGIMKQELNLVMGFIEPGETPVQAARRELKEECGITPGRLTLLGEFYIVPSLINSEGFAVYARVARMDMKESMPDPGEELQVVRIPRARIKEWLRKGKITNASSMIALYKAMEKGLLR